MLSLTKKVQFNPFLLHFRTMLAPNYVNCFKKRATLLDDDVIVLPELSISDGMVGGMTGGMGGGLG